ncbi:DUF5049 domain-containing protein [Lancefieldella parvula]
MGHRQDEHARYERRLALAFESDYHELVCYIEEHRREYWHFILKGEE